MVAIAPKGIDVRQTTIGGAGALVFRASLKNSAGTKVTTGTINLFLYQLMADGTLQQYDFHAGYNTFSAAAPNTASAAMNYQKPNGQDSGIWTYALTTLTGFTQGGIYIAQVSDQSGTPTAVPVDQEREFQYGGQQSDQATTVSGSPSVNVAGQSPGVLLATDLFQWLEKGEVIVSTGSGGVSNPNCNGNYFLCYRPDIIAASATLSANGGCAWMFLCTSGLLALIYDPTLNAGAGGWGLYSTGNSYWAYVSLLFYTGPSITGTYVIGGINLGSIAVAYGQPQNPPYNPQLFSALLAALSTSPIVLQSPVNQAGTLQIAQGTDYPSGNAINFGVPSTFMSLTGSTPSLEITPLVGGVPVTTPPIVIAGTIQTGSLVINGTTYTTWLQFTPTAAQTAQLANLAPNAYVYRVRCYWYTGQTITQTIEVVSQSPCTALW